MNGRPKLAAFRIERRSVAVSIFLGTHLDYADVRQLSSVHEKAESSAVGFVNWIVSAFHIDSAAIEKFENGEEILRAQLNRAIEQSLAIDCVSMWQVSKAELFQGFGYPPVSSRKEIRQVVTSIWPILASKQASGTKLDAVALGLYAQTERLFHQ